MCIIILNKKGKLSEKVLQQASLSNRDGAGIMYAVNGKIHVRKSLDNNDIIAEYNRVRKDFPDIAIGLHFRIKTDGEIDTANCHPYKVNEGTYLMHNGILRDYSGLNTAESDTRLFIHDVLKHVPGKTLLKPYMVNLIRQAIGGNNKFLIMRATGQYLLVNEKVGHYDEAGDNWFSNSSYCSPKKHRSINPINWKCQYCGKRLKNMHERASMMCDFCWEYINTTSKE